MNPIYIAITLLFVSLPVQAGDVWVVNQKRLSSEGQPKKVVWVITQTPAAKSCHCSSQCVCGCNQGKECDCNKRSTPYRIVSPSEAWSCTVGNG